MKKTTFYVVLIAVLISLGDSSCNQQSASKGSSGNDSAEIKKLLSDLYKWHMTVGDNIADFEMLIRDSLQVGVDTVKLAAAIKEFRNADLFDEDFLKNYELAGRTVDRWIRRDTVKYFNEINFSFQDADPWTGMQDYPDHYWDSLMIHDLVISADSASLTWTLPPESEPYKVRLKRRQNKWRVSYLAGFDTLYMF